MARIVQVSFRYSLFQVVFSLIVRTGSLAVTSLTCSVSFLTRLGLVPKRRNGSVPGAFVDLTTRTPVLPRFSRLPNGTKGYPLSHSPLPADEVHDRSDRLHPITALQGSCRCNLCVEQTTIPSPGQKRPQNHLLVSQEALQPIHRARPGDHRNLIIYPHGHTSDPAISLFCIFVDGFPLASDMYSTQLPDLTTLGQLLI